jgi:hypothetical protein
MTTTNNIHATPRPVRIRDKYSQNELYAAAHEMRKIGGSFAAAIASAFFLADLGNQRILLDAFGDLFEKFIPKEVRLEAEMEQGNWFADLR